jgi:hypothetical protein
MVQSGISGWRIKATPHWAIEIVVPMQRSAQRQPKLLGNDLGGELAAGMRAGILQSSIC